MQKRGKKAVVVSGRVRDSLYVLDGLLEQSAALIPLRLTGDTDAYTN